MAERYVAQVELKTNIEKVLKELKETQDRVDKLEGKDYKINLDIDTKTLESAIQKLDKMLDSLGKGTGDFKQLENLSKQLESITSDVRDFSKTFGKVDDSGAKTLLSSIQNIDKSLFDLSQNILNVNKNMSNMGGNTFGAVKEIENIGNAYQNATKEAEKLADAQSNLGNKTNISSEISAVQQQEKIQNKVTQSIQEQNKAIDESIKKTLTLNDVRQKQWEIIQKTNPKEEGTNSTWVDKPEDAKTFYEVNHKDSDYPFNENYSDDWTVKDKMNVEATGKITVYSSYPIEDGNWVTPSKEEGLSYAGSGKLYSVTMDPRDIAWVDAGQGQVAHISDELKEVIDLSTKAETQVQNIDNKTNETGSQSTLNTLDDTIAKYETIVALVKEYYDLSNNKKDTIGMSSDDERISEIRKQLKSYTQNPDYNGEYKMGFGGSGKNIFAKSVDLSQEEMLQEICNMLGVEIPKNADKAKEAIKEVASATTSTEQKKDAFPDKDISASVESATNSIKEENNVLEQNTQKVKENTQAKEQNANVNFNKYDKRLDSYNGKIDKYKTTIDRFNDGGWTSSAYLENVQAVKNAVKEYETLLNELKGKDASLVTSEDINQLDNYEKKIKDTIATVTNMSASEKGYNFVSGQKELDKIHKLLNENSKMSSEAKAKIKAYYAEIESGNPSMSLDKIHGEILKIYNAEVEAGRAGRSFLDTLKNSGFHQFAAQMAGMFSFYDVINGLKQVASTVIDLNTQITDLAKVSEATSSQIYDDFNSYADIAKDIGGTISDTISATADWSRNGYNLPDSKELARVALLYKNVGDGIDIDTANESLISTLRGFKMEADEAEKIIDIFNNVSNNEPIDSGGIGEALQRSAASFNAANTSLQESVALISTTNSVIQNPEKVGNMWKVVSMRIRSATSELEQAGEDTDGLVTSTADLQKMIKAMTGYDILESDGKTFKSIYDIVLNISKVWNNLSDLDQSSLLQALAGKQQSNALAAALSNPELLEKSYQEAMDSAGSAAEEEKKYQQSVQYSIDQTKAKLEELSADLLSSDFLKGAIDAGGKLIDILDGIVKSGNAIPTLLTAIGAGLSFKNIGKCYVSA